jgi:hypothetical protein
MQAPNRPATYVIRHATTNDVHALRQLVLAARARWFCGPALIAEVDGVAAAALSLADGRLIADPSTSTAELRQRLRRHRDAAQA